MTAGTPIRFIVPGRTYASGHVHAGNAMEIAAVITDCFPKLAEHYGRIAAVVEEDGVSHIYASDTRKR